MRNELDAKGKGEMDYDFKQDILLFKVKGREYDHSVEFQNFVADIDKEGFVTGIQIMDASQVFGVSKYSLKNIIDWRFQAEVANNVITVRLRFSSKVRNKTQPENFTQQFTQESPSDLRDARVATTA